MTRTVSARSVLFFSGVIAFIVMTVLNSCMMRKTVAPENFAMEESKLTTQIDEASDPEVLSDLYVRRARLRLRSDNPHPDYRGALRDFKSSLDMNPEQWDAADIMDWVAALSRMTALEHDAAKLKAKYQQSESLNKTLTNTVEQLEKQSQELRKSIEELQSLELQMEQRRQQLR